MNNESLNNILRKVDEVVYSYRGTYLKNIEEAILIGSLKNQTYLAIAEANGYSEKYIAQNAGFKFYRLLSKALGKPVNKNTINAAIRRLMSEE